jgi:hypothetical protein
MPDEKAPSSGAFLPASLMYFCSGEPMHFCSGVDTSAFNKIRAFSSRCAGLFPFRISVSSCSRSSSLSLTTYFFTEISFAAMIASVARSGDESESLNPFKLVEAGD